ncbi:M48 family metalloprotease [Humibacter sp.]|jgi:heat shock protein HtpX|uniref:M48 family metalloprotease n=1 Tax=Humibacter sp. TaxID=1940291 RepID=UPI002D091068|nr:M48 family metalloprotease [Humibacter sp.]HVX09243.1 M48 family metalloprotease [Humibacter sp.]
MYRAIAANKRNTVFIIFFFLVIIGLLGWLASYLFNSWTILIVVMVVAIAYALIQYFAASGQAIMASGAVEIQKSDNPRLWNTVENLSIATGMPMPKVYIINDPAPNAFATGRDPQHAVVAATTGLLDIMDDSELEGVMAHELGHVRNYDIRVSMIVFGLTVAVGLVADILLRMSMFGAFAGGNNRNNNNGGGGGNPILLIVGIVALVLAPLMASLVQLAVSRQREYLADATSAMTTRNPDELASALAKLEQYGRPMRRQNSSMAHLWIANPLKPTLMSRLFSTHPPIEERIARLKKIGSTF